MTKKKLIVKRRFVLGKPRRPSQAALLQEEQRIREQQIREASRRIPPSVA